MHWRKCGIQSVGNRRLTEMGERLSLMKGSNRIVADKSGLVTIYTRKAKVEEDYAGEV